jgi:apolipoprotein N-acyltransferase
VTGRARLASAAVSGVLLGLAHPPGPAWLGLLAPVPWFAHLVRDRGEGHGRAAYLFGLCLFGTGLRWLWQLHPAFLAALAALLALYPLLFARAYRSVARGFGPAAALASLPALWVGVDFLRERALSGFPWILPGHLLAGSDSLRQGADLLGVPLLSLPVVALPAALGAEVAARTWKGSAPAARHRLGLLGASAALLLALAVYGGARLRGGTDRPGPRVLVVQPCFAQGLKGEARREAPSADRMRNAQLVLSLEGHRADPAAELVIWGETMIPPLPGGGDLREVAPGRDGPDPATRIFLHSLVDTVGIVPPPGPRDPPRAAPEARRLLAGAVLRCRDGGKRNTMLLVGPLGVVEDRVDKVHLTPFGEYLPLVDLLPEGLRFKVEDAVLEISPFLPDLKPGVDRTLEFRLPRLGEPLRLGGLICYENIFPAEARDRAARGADILVNPANYAWYGPSCRAQALAMTRLRAVEVRRPVVLAGNDGPTAVVDGAGRVRRSLPEGTPGVLAAEVPLDGRGTLYAAVGDLLGWSLLGAGGLLAAAGWWRARRGTPAKAAGSGGETS